MEAGATSASVPAESPAEYTRLHVSPFNPDLLRTIIPPSILPNAQNISYHSLQTFPESPYGFVDLPMMDAAKIRKKLNGSILKGKKIRIEEARPATKAVATPDADADAEEPPTPRKEKKDRSKKRKLGEETLTGAEIGDRSVKRGWTTPSATLSKLDKHAKDERKAVVKSKYTTGPECLFKTVLPPNVAVNTKPTSSDAKPKRRPREKAGKGAIVHEFAKSTKYATFLRGSIESSSKQEVAEFIAGKGWVDKDGNVVEEVVSRTRAPAQPLKKKANKEPLENAAQSFEEAHASDDGSSSSDDSGDVVDDQVLQIVTPPTKEDSPTSSSGSSSDEEDSVSGDSSASSGDLSHAEESSGEDRDPAEGSESSRQHSSSGPATGLSIKIPKPAMGSKHVATEDVHPLEALYKRPLPDTSGTPQATHPSFSFFDPDGDVDESLEAEPYDQVPFTPFTQKEFEYRGLRSAAPTPDTSHANRRFMWPTDNDEGNEDQLQGKAVPIYGRNPSTNPTMVHLLKPQKVIFRNGSTNIEERQIELGKRGESLHLKRNAREKTGRTKVVRTDKQFFGLLLMTLWIPT